MTRATVGTHLYRAFATMVAVIIAIGVVATIGVYLQFRTVDELTARVMPERLANAQVRAVLGDAQRGIRGYLLGGDPSFEQAYTEALRDYAAASNRLRRLAPDGDRAAVDQQLGRSDAWLRLAETQRVSATDRGRTLSALGKPLFADFQARNTALDRILDRRAAGLRDRTRRAETLTIVAVGTMTVLGALAALLTAVRITRVVNRPLRSVVATLARLRAGELSARAPVDGPVDVRSVAETLNELSEENEQARAMARSRTRLREAAREAGLRVREHLSVDSALDAAADVLGREFRADAVVVRLTGGDGHEKRSICWTPEHEAHECTLSRLPVAWLADRFARGEVWRAGDLRVEPSGIPADERAALLELGAVSVVTVPFGTAPAPDGAITLIRTSDGTPWQPGEVEAAEWVAADVGRGVQQGRLYEQEQRLVAELRDLDHTKSAFLATVSHELRTPLTSISGFLELLRDTDEAGPLTAGQQRMVDVIERNTNRLRNLIEDLLTLSRVEAGTFKTVRQPVDVADLVQTAVRSIPLSNPRLTVRVECPSHPLVAMVDPYQLDRVIVNLLSNAVKFSPGGGHVTVRVREDERDLLLSVSDTGIGIPFDEQQELFNRFFRASNAVAQTIPGTGLGLTIVRTILANHGGDVTLHSTPGEGTTVTIRFPREAALVAS
jgi:two-component system phosphate regulon sensor histidine kinase PhoR